MTGEGAAIDETLNLPLFLTLTVLVGPPILMGDAGHGLRRVVPLLGGTVEGAHTGRVIPGGGDWQTVARDGSLDISARYALEFDEGVVEVQSNGIRTATPDILERLGAGDILPVDLYYFRTAIRFVTGVSALDHFNRMLAVSVGERFPDRVVLKVYRVV